MESFYAVGAHLNSGAINFGPLEVWIASGFRSRIIMTSQKLTSGYHYRLFTAVFTFCSHDVGI